MSKLLGAIGPGSTCWLPTRHV